MVKGDADLNVLARIEPNADASKWPAGRLTEFNISIQLEV